MNSELKAVLFDLDGVIVDTARYHYLAWKKLADQEDIYFDKVINERLKGVSRRASLEIILESSNKIYSEEEKNNMTEKKNDWYIEMISQLKSNEVLPGVIEFLGHLKKAGIKTAICSASKSAQYIIDKLELNDYFDTVVGGNDVTKSKPDPEVFLIAAKRLGILPSCCVVFEDAFAGIEAAIAGGMKAVGIGEYDILKKADSVYKDITMLTVSELKRLW